MLPKPSVAKLVAAVNGTDTDLSKLLDAVALYARNHLIPTCAMHVQRTSDGASDSAYQHPGNSACICYYDDKVPNETTSCTRCTTDAECADAGAATSCNVFGLPQRVLRGLSPVNASIPRRSARPSPSPSLCR